METAALKSFHDFSVTDIDGNPFDLSSLKGKKVLVVNTASECGLTPQYAQLQELFEAKGGDDFTIVGFPANNFGGQEPGSDAQIQTFCSKNYGVTFPMLAKVGTKEGNSPIFDELAGMTGARPNWNFCKYVVSKDGSEARFFKSGVGPDSAELRGAIAEYRGR